MPSLKASLTLIRQVVNSWYGVIGMPMRIETREESYDNFERTHSYIPPELWPFINHHARLFSLWADGKDCVDIVVWNKPSQSYRMAQDLCFKDAYPDVPSWHRAILALIQDPELEVWVVTHDEVDPPSSPA